MHLGVDYYPEHWAQELLEEDLQRIQKMGCNMIRIGEFAWHLMEKEEGVFDFSFFDKVIEEAKKYQLKIMFGTPTATFPAWLSHKYPDILSCDENNHQRSFGGRRQYCYNSPHYLKYSLKIVKKLVAHYSSEESIVAWQLDNELGHEGSDFCYCEHCQKDFGKFLEEKYENIETLNETWGTIFWGQTYNSFSQIPLPKPTITVHNPSLLLDFARFRSYSIYRFAKIHIDKIRKYKGENQKVTHNFYGGFFEKAYDQNKIAELLDFVSYDNYPVWGGLKKPIEPCHIALTHSYVRGLKLQNYWIVEELMGAQGHNIIGYLPRPLQAQMWAYQAMAHGCENMLFFRYRGMNKGAEQFCLGIVDQNNQTSRKYLEVQSFMNHIRHFKKVLETPIESKIALLYHFDNIWSWHYQKQSQSFNFTQECLRLWKPFYESQNHIDVISSEKDFSRYKIILVPVMQIIDQDLALRFEKFVEEGGTLLFSYRSGIKDSHNNIHFGMYYPCWIQKICGIKIEECEVLQEDQQLVIQSNFFPEKKGTCDVWRDLIEPQEAESLYSYTDYFYKQYSCITRNKYKKGCVYYIGGGVNHEILKEIGFDILQEQGISSQKVAEGLEVVSRMCEGKTYLFVQNHTENEIYFKNKNLKPYESFIYQEEEEEKKF